MCSLQDTGPPDVILPLRGAIQTPAERGSSKAGNYKTIGRNLDTLDYYASALGTGKQFQGYGIRKAYSTGIECSNIKGQRAYRLADGTAVGIKGEYGVVPRLIGSLAGLVPSDLVSSAKTSTPCQMMWIHENTDTEANAIRHKGMNGVPEGNKVPVSDANGVDYVGMNTKCEQGAFGKGACKRYPVQTSDINTSEGFCGGGCGGGGGYDWRRYPMLDYWRYKRRWYNRYPPSIYHSPPIVIDDPPYRPSPNVVLIRETSTASTPTSTSNITSVILLALVGGVIGAVAMRC